MATASTATLVDALRQYRLLEAGQLREVERVSSQCPEPRALGKQLVQRGWLSSFQINQLLLGRAADLMLGPYLLLDRLGEGGNGQVFKARHQTLARVVALKVLRKELVADAEAVGRFYREIEVVSQIAHPNIVHAYDAGPIGAALVLAMEFVDGIDLDRLVKQRGALAAPRACDFIRQAACGLAHAHEKGLIHRDIKPANLLLAKAQGSQPLGLTVVKILDLGLARLQQPAADSQTNNLTLEGSAVTTQGTPDYMAPEQALDFHTADRRADIYSLGCTFYFLLAGKAPFPGGSLAQKLMKHQMAEPPAVEQVRTDLPPDVPKLLRKMLAKQPADRFQTAGEVADALARFADKGNKTQTVPDQETMIGDTGFSTVNEQLPGAVPVRDRRRRLAFVIGGGLLLIGLLIFGLLWALPSGTSREPTVVEHKTPVTVPITESKPVNPVTIVSVSTGRKLETMPAKVGVVTWLDRDYKLTALGPSLDGAILIRQFMSDKYINVPDYLKLTLYGPAQVYVGYDKRATTLPAWLNDGTWQPSTEVISSTTGGEAAACPRKVFVKRFAAGYLTLGGNVQAPAKGSDAHYVLIVKPLP